MRPSSGFSILKKVSFEWAVKVHCGPTMHCTMEALSQHDIETDRSCTSGRAETEQPSHSFSAVNAVLAAFSSLFFAMSGVLSSARSTTVYLSLFCDLIVKKLTPEGRKVRARERERITHSPLSASVSLSSSSSNRVMVGN